MNLAIVSFREYTLPDKDKTVFITYMDVDVRKFYFILNNHKIQMFIWLTETFLKHKMKRALKTVQINPRSFDSLAWRVYKRAMLKNSKKITYPLSSTHMVDRTFSNKREKILKNNFKDFDKYFELFDTINEKTLNFNSRKHIVLRGRHQFYKTGFYKRPYNFMSEYFWKKKTFKRSHNVSAYFQSMVFYVKKIAPKYSITKVSTFKKYIKSLNLYTSEQVSLKDVIKILYGSRLPFLDINAMKYALIKKKKKEYKRALKKIKKQNKFNTLINLEIASYFNNPVKINKKKKVKFINNIPYKHVFLPFKLQLKPFNKRLIMHFLKNLRFKKKIFYLFMSKFSLKKKKELLNEESIATILKRNLDKLFTFKMVGVWKGPVTVRIDFGYPDVTYILFHKYFKYCFYWIARKTLFQFLMLTYILMLILLKDLTTFLEYFVHLFKKSSPRFFFLFRNFRETMHVIPFYLLNLRGIYLQIKGKIYKRSRRKVKYILSKGSRPIQPNKHKTFFAYRDLNIKVGSFGFKLWVVLKEHRNFDDKYVSKDPTTGELLL